MIPTENLLEAFMWLKRAEISCVVLSGQLFRNIVVKNNSQLALYPVESLTLSNDDDSNDDDSNDDDSNDDDSEDDGDLTAWKFSVQYAEQIDDAPDDDGEIEEEECEEEDFDQAEDFEFEADFDECFLRFICVLRICSIDCCVIDASCGKASLSSAQFKSFIDATKSSNIAVMRLYDISLRQLTADEFFGLTRVPGLCDLLVQHCSLRSTFVDAKFIRVCGECGITTLTVSPGPVDGAHYATDDQSLLDFCFKRRAGTSPPPKLDVHLSHPAISADFVAGFKQAFPSNPFRGRVELDFGGPRKIICGMRRAKPLAVPKLHVSVTKGLISFQGRSSSY